MHISQNTQPGLCQLEAETTHLIFFVSSVTQQYLWCLGRDIFLPETATCSDFKKKMHCMSLCIVYCKLTTGFMCRVHCQSQKRTRSRLSGPALYLASRSIRAKIQVTGKVKELFFFFPQVIEYFCL